MELRIGKESRHVPEAWIPRWQFLVDYLEEIGTEVQWNYTDVAAVDKWIALNENMDDVAERRSKKKLPRKNARLLEDLRSKDWPYDRKWISLTDVYGVVEFMNPVNDDYLLHIVIEDTLSEQRKKEMYARLGRYVVTSGANPCRPNDGVVAKAFRLVDYRPIEVPEDFPVSPSTMQSIYAVLGVIRNSYQKRTRADPYDLFKNHNSISDIVSLDWEEVYRMRPILVGDELEQVRAKHDRFLQSLWIIIVCLYLESPLIKFMVGIAIPPIGDGMNPLYVHNPYDEFYIGTITTWLEQDSASSTQKLIELIDRYVDTVEPESLVALAKGVLGLGPLLDNTGSYIVGERRWNKRTIEVPYFFISVHNSLYLPSGSGGVKEEDYLDVCLYLGSKWGSFWLQSCIKCLLRILEHRRSKKLDWSDLITSYKKHKNISVMATKETKRLVLFCEAAMEAAERIEEKTGGVTAFSSLPALYAYL